MTKIRFNHPLPILLTIVALAVGNNSPAKESPGSKDTTRITFWEFSGHAALLIKELVDEFNRTEGPKSGIVVELTNHGRSYLHSIEMAMDNNYLPDIFPSREPFVSTLISTNRVAAIDTLPGGPALLKNFNLSQLQVNVHKKGNHIFAVPRMVVTFKLIYNKDLFVKAGLVDKNGEAAPPTTWEEFLSAAKRISDLDPGKTFGVIFPMKGSSQGEYGFFWEYKIVRPTSNSFGKLYFDNQTGKYDFSFYKPLLEFMCALRRNGSVFPGEKVISDDAARIRFGQRGNIGMYIAASWDVGVLTEQYPATVDWGVADIPLMVKDRRYSTISIIDYGYLISASAARKYPDKIMAVYRYVNGLYWQKRLYEDGRFLPSLKAVYNNAKKPTVRGWAAFGDYNVINAPTPDHVLKINGPKWYQVFQMIYDGRLEVDSALADLTQSYNDALTRAVKTGQLNLTDYIIRPSPSDSTVR